MWANLKLTAGAFAHLEDFQDDIHFLKSDLYADGLRGRLRNGKPGLSQPK